MLKPAQQIWKASIHEKKKQKPAIPSRRQLGHGCYRVLITLESHTPYVCTSYDLQTYPETWFSSGFFNCFFGGLVASYMIRMNVYLHSAIDVEVPSRSRFRPPFLVGHISDGQVNLSTQSEARSKSRSTICCTTKVKDIPELGSPKDPFRYSPTEQYIFIILKLLVTSATLLVTSALLVVTRCNKKLLNYLSHVPYFSASPPAVFFRPKDTSTSSATVGSSASHPRNGNRGGEPQVFHYFWEVSLVFLVAWEFLYNAL